MLRGLGPEAELPQRLRAHGVALQRVRAVADAGPDAVAARTPMQARCKHPTACRAKEPWGDMGFELGIRLSSR